MTTFDSFHFETDDEIPITVFSNGSAFRIIKTNDGIKITELSNKGIIFVKPSSANTIEIVGKI